MTVKIFGQEVLQSRIKRTLATDNTGPIVGADSIKKTDLEVGKVHIIRNVEDRLHCVENKKEFEIKLANGLTCEPVNIIYILKSNTYSCWDLYLPIWFYGFLPEHNKLSNFSSSLLEGYFPNGNGTDIIQTNQKRADSCIFYMK